MINQIQPDYKSSILTFAQMAQNTLLTANIRSPEQAMSADTEIMADLSANFPRLHNLAIELNCFWGGELPLFRELPQSPIDRSAAFVTLTQQINQFLEVQPEFNFVSAILPNAALQVDDLLTGLNVVDSQTDPAQKIKASAWLRSSLSLLKTQFYLYRLQRKQISEEKILNSNLPEILAENLSKSGKQLNVEAVTEALCQTYLRFGDSLRKPAPKKIEKQLLSRLKQQGCVDPKAETLPEVPEVVENINRLIADNCQFNLYLADIERLVDQAANQLKDGADTALVTERIFQQLQEQGHRPIEFLKYNPLQKERPRPPSVNIKPEVFLRQVQEVNQNYGWITSYQQTTVVPELVAESKKLIKGWVNLTAAKYDEAVGTISDLLNFTEMPDAKKDYLESTLLTQAETVINVCEAVHDSFGLNFNQTGFNLAHLQAMKATPRLEYDQLIMLDSLFNSFGEYYAQNPDQFATGFNDEISSDYIGRLIALPPSAERFKLMRYSGLAMKDIKESLAEESQSLEFRCAHNLQKVNRPVLGQLISNIKDYCAPDTDVAVLAQNIDINVNRFYLLPQYGENEILPGFSRSQVNKSLFDFVKKDPEERKIIDSIVQEHYRRVLPLHINQINRRSYPSDSFLNLFDNYQEVVSQMKFYNEGYAQLNQAMPQAEAYQAKYNQLNKPELVSPQPGVNRYLLASMRHRSN